MINLTPLIAAMLTVAALAVPGRAETAQDTDGDGIPDAAELLLGTDPMVADTDGDGQNDLADKTPTFVANPMVLGGPPAPFTIAEALVEDNIDTVRKADAPDHLELHLHNSASAALAGFTVHIGILDADSGIQEGSYQRLEGFVLPAGADAILHFDDGTDPGHFRANPNSIYHTSKAKKTFTVALQAEGFAPVTVVIAKDATGDEAAD